MAQGTTKAADSRGFKPHQWYLYNPKPLSHAFIFVHFFLSSDSNPDGAHGDVKTSMLCVLNCCSRMQLSLPYNGECTRNVMDTGKDR